MAKNQTAKIRVTNRTSGRATITLSHRFGKNTPETKTWEGVRSFGTTPVNDELVVHYKTGLSTADDLDWWWVEVKVEDGEHPGIYTSGGSIVNKTEKECMMRDNDKNMTHIFTVSFDHFHINLKTPSCRADMTRRGPYSPISHVFVLMLENRSFDNLLGFSKIKGKDAVTGKPTEIDGLTGSESNTYDKTEYKVKKGAVDPMLTDPGHEFLNTLEQLCGHGVLNPFPTGPYPAVKNSGFVSNYATTETEGTGLPPVGHNGDVLCCSDPSEIPALITLAKEFAVCDRWFSSMPGPTWPNRLFAAAASSGGMDDSPASADIIARDITPRGFGFPNGSIFHHLKGTDDYRIYHDQDNQFASSPARQRDAGAFPISVAVQGAHWNRVYRFKNFAKDLKGPYHAKLTYIEPHYGDAANDTYKGGSSQHPMDSLAAGDALIAATYEAIRNSPLWKSSVLIIIYDEHGGFYDHVLPPSAPSPADKGKKHNKNGFDFTQYGVRVPAVVISPFIPKNTIDHTLYDHTSILGTVAKIFDLDYLTERDKKANTLSHLRSGGFREDCPIKVTPAAPPPAARSARVESAGARDDEPLPEKGNLIGFLRIALKTDVELSDGSAASEAAILARFQTIRTRGDAREYFREVALKVKAFLATRKLPVNAD